MHLSGEMFAQHGQGLISRLPPQTSHKIELGIPALNTKSLRQETQTSLGYTARSWIQNKNNTQTKTVAAIHIKPLSHSVTQSKGPWGKGSVLSVLHTKPLGSLMLDVNQAQSFKTEQRLQATACEVGTHAECLAPSASYCRATVNSSCQAYKNIHPLLFEATPSPHDCQTGNRPVYQPAPKLLYP